MHGEWLVCNVEWGGGGMSVLVDFAGFLLFVHSQPTNLVYLVKYENFCYVDMVDI
jgi:hypothetical protein